MQGVENQSVILSTISDVTSQLTTPYWPVAANASTVLFSFSTIASSALTPEETTQGADREAPVSLSILPSPRSRRSKREESGYDVISDLLEKYYSLFLLLFGTLGNALCFGVLSRKTFRRSTIGIFLRFLTLADLSALWTGVFYFAAKGTFNTNIRTTNELSCKIHFWLSYACCDLGSWALILVSSARLASILRPMSHFITNKRAYVAILLVIVLALSVNLPIFFMYGDVYIPSRGITKHCVIAHTSYRYFIIHIWTWIVLLKFAVIPGTILLGLNIVLIVHVYRSKRIIEDMQRGSFNSNRRQAKPQLKSHSDDPNDETCSNCCCGYSIKQVPKAHGRGLANTISFSKWRRKAVINKDINSDLNNSRNIKNESQATSLVVREETKGSAENNLQPNHKRNFVNGNVVKPCFTSSKNAFQPSKKHSQIKFQGQKPAKLTSPQTSLSSKDNTESASRPFKTCSLHESYADIKQLQEAYIWNGSNTGGSVKEHILFLNNHVNNEYMRNKFKSCSNIPTVFLEEKGRVPNYNRPCSLSLLQKTPHEHCSESFENSAESSCDQFFTGGELELSPAQLKSQSSSRDTIQDQMLYDALTTSSNFQEEVEDIPEIKSFVNYKGGKAKTSLCSDSEDDSGESSCEEFFSCADDTKFSPLLQNKNGNGRVSAKADQSKSTIMYVQFHKHKFDQSTHISDDSIALQGNQNIKNLAECQTISVIVNDLALLPEKAFEPHISCEKHIQVHRKEQNGNDCFNSAPVFQSQSCNNSPVRHNTKPTTSVVTADETSSSDCLHVVTSNKICDINVTRCSSTNDVISLKDQTLEKSPESTDTKPARFQSDITDLDNAGTSQCTDKAPTEKSDKLCVGHKRDKPLSVTDLNLSLSSLGKTSLNSGNTDISSFTIAAPSAFTSAENLTTTNAEMLKCQSSHTKSSTDQQTTGCPRAVAASKRKRSQQQKKGRKSMTSMFPRSSARPKNLTRTLLVINSVFLFCNIPIVIYMTGKTYFFPGGYNDRQNLFNTCANFIMYTNNALNFLLYCLTGTRFRHQLRAMFVDAGIAIHGSIRRPPRRAHL